MSKRGISLLDLASPFPDSQAIVPADLAARLENLAVISHRSTTSPDAITHSGTIQPVSDLGFPALGDWPVEVPGLNAGIPFRMVRTRSKPKGDQNLEPGGTTAFVDLEVKQIAITVPGLRAATLVPADSASLGHLLHDPNRSAVKIVGSGVVRIDLSGDGNVVRFVDLADPFDPSAPTGAVFGLEFVPASFFIADSEIGMVVDSLVYDASSQVTPPEIIARGHTPAWQGISISEATLYLPPNTPLVDRVNVGVKNVLLGSPFGLQGRVEVAFGRTPINTAVVQFFQKTEEGEGYLDRMSGSGRDFTVPFLQNTPDTMKTRAQLSFDQDTLASSTEPKIEWRLPNGQPVHKQETPWFDATVGDTMTAQFSDVVDGARLQDAITFYTFKQGDPDLQHAPTITAELGETDRGEIDRPGVASVSGSAKALDGLKLTAAIDDELDEAKALKWKHGEGSDAHTSTGRAFVLTPSSETGLSFIVLTDSENRTRRIRVEVLTEGELLVGAWAGVLNAEGEPQDIRGVAKTNDLTYFNRYGDLIPFASRATISEDEVEVPDGGLAEVTLGIGKGTDPEAEPDPVVEKVIRHLRITFEFDDANPKAFHPYLRPKDEHGNEKSVKTLVTEWSAIFSGDVTFLAIGRCCDMGSDDYNRVLAEQRANSVVDWLTTGTLLTRGEQDSPTDMAAKYQDMTPKLSEDKRAATRLIKEEHPDWESWGPAPSHPIREAYRRVDIYAVGGDYTHPPGANPSAQKKPTDTQELDPALRRSWVPGQDLDEVPLPRPSGPKFPWLLRLVVAWDSPTVTNWGDAIPTQAEFTFEWATEPKIIPAPEGDEALNIRPPSEPAGTTHSSEVYTLTGRWSHDSRSGQTLFSLAITSSGDPDGLAAIDSEFLAIALALAPALLAGIDAAGIDGEAVRIGALAGASAALATFAKDGEVVIHSAEIEHRQRGMGEISGSRTRILLDYTASVGLDIHAPGLGTLSTDAGKPLKVRYQKAGLELDDSKTEFHEKFGLVFENASFDVADMGRWQIDGPLGQLLQVVATRAGVGSSWFELDLEFALDLGVVSIQGATVRVTFGADGFHAELRGLGVTVDIPGVLKGKGRLVLGDGGAFNAALELDLISVGAKAMGQMTFEPATDFLSLEVGLLLPVGIPLAATGLGIFGFKGLFVSNGKRALPAGFDDDPVGREIEWFRHQNLDEKFTDEPGQWAIGLGMIVGTMPDQAFTFNATGMFVVAFPDPAVIFGIEATLVEKPAVEPPTQGEDDESAGLSILGLVAVDDKAVTVGVRGEYSIPHVLDLNLPIDGYFPTSGSGDSYVRIGADGFEGRTGDPASLTLLPGTLDAEVSAFLMVEEKQLHHLGGDEGMNFDGFSVGFGAGWGIDWSAGPIKLSASAQLLVGLGTDPFLLRGSITVTGELNLVVLTVSARGKIVATVWNDGGVKVRLEGEFCGSVSLFFFSISGCVGIEVGSALEADVPKPPAPIGKVSLTDRRGFTTALASPSAPPSGTDRVAGHRSGNRVHAPPGRGPLGQCVQSGAPAHRPEVVGDERDEVRLSGHGRPDRARRRGGPGGSIGLGLVDSDDPARCARRGRRCGLGIGGDVPLPTRMGSGTVVVLDP